MESSPFKRVSKENINGFVIEELLNLLPSTFFEDPISSIQKMKGEVIYANCKKTGLGPDPE